MMTSASFPPGGLLCTIDQEHIDSRIRLVAEKRWLGYAENIRQQHIALLIGRKQRSFVLKAGLLVFVGDMAGENKGYKDMDPAPLSDGGTATVGLTQETE